MAINMYTVLWRTEDLKKFFLKDWNRSYGEKDRRTAKLNITEWN